MPLVFQYGSNMDLARFEERLGPVDDHGLIELADHTLAFNIESGSNGCAAANLVQREGTKVLGRVFEVSEEQLQLLDQVEGVGIERYERKSVTLQDGRSAITYVATDSAVEEYEIFTPDLAPSDKYLGHVVRGLEQLKAPLDHISEVIRIGHELRGDRAVQVEVDHHYDNPATFYRGTIGLCRELRERLGVRVGNFVQVRGDSNQGLNLRVQRIPKDLTTGGACEASDTTQIATISRFARESLGITDNQIDSREELDRFRSVYGPLEIVALPRFCTSAVFVYGTLMFEPVVEEVLGDDFDLQPATLTGYKRYQVKGESFPAAVPKLGEVLHGKLLELFDPEDIERLDRFEGVEQGLYTREQVIARLPSGEEIEAFLYVAGESLAVDRRRKWDPEDFERSQLDDYIG